MFKKLILKKILLVGVCFFYILSFNQFSFGSDEINGVEESKGADSVDISIGKLKIAAQRSTINKLEGLKSILDRSSDKNHLVLAEIESISDFGVKLSMLLHVLHNENYSDFSYGYLQDVLPLAQILGLDERIIKNLVSAISEDKNYKIIEIKKEIQKLGFSGLSDLQDDLINEIVTYYSQNKGKFLELSGGREHILPLEILKLLYDKGYLPKETVKKALGDHILIDDVFNDIEIEKNVDLSLELDFAGDYGDVD